MTASDNLARSKTRSKQDQGKYDDNLRRVEPYKRSTKAKQSWSLNNVTYQ